MRLNGRRVLITGASRGIGAALARGLRTRGAELALVARSGEALEKVARDVAGVAYPCDLTELEGLEDLVAGVEADGPVDILVNNAGISNVGWFLDRTPAEINQVVTLNLLAPMHLCRLVLPGMVQRGRGSVVNISSMAAVIAPPGLAAYGGAKAGLSHFTAGLRADLRDQPVTFTTVHLGSVSTDMDEAARSYGPLRELAARSSGRDITPMDVFVSAVVNGIERDREEVTVPRMMASLAGLTNVPRRVGRLAFRGAMVSEPRTDQD